MIGEIKIAEIKHAPRQIGRFKISRELMMQSWPKIHIVFSKIIPIQIHWDFHGVGHYTAFSKLFDEIEEGVEPPLYEFPFETLRNGRVRLVSCEKSKFQ